MKVRVTNRMIEGIRNARLAGKTWREIVVEFGVSTSTAMRYGDPHHAEMQKKYERNRYQRDRKKKQEESH